MPDAVAPLRHDESIAAASFAVSRGLQRIVEELEVLDEVRADARLDDVHVHVLGNLASWIRTRTDGVEAIVAAGIGSRPAAQAAMAVARDAAQP